jgi:hypothetical protein
MERVKVALFSLFLSFSPIKQLQPIGRYGRLQGLFATLVPIFFLDFLLVPSLFLFSIGARNEHSLASRALR